MATRENTPSDESTLFDDSSAVTPVGPEETGPATSEPAARKRTTRRSTRKQAEPTVSKEPEASAGSQAETRPDEAPAAAEGPAPTKPARRRASRKKAAAPEVAVPDSVTEMLAKAEAAAGEHGPGDVAEVESSEDTPTGVASAASATADDAIDEAARVGTSDREVAEDEAPEDQTPKDETGEGENANGETAEDDAPLPVVQSFSVLFQAPDPEAAATATRSRRRRAEREPEPEHEHEPEHEEAEPTGPEATQPAAEEGQDEEETPRRSRRRRGGKGRRGRGGADSEEGPADTDEGESADESPQPTPESDQGQADESDEDHDGQEDHGADEEDGGTSRRRRRRRRSGSGGEAGDEAGVSTRARSGRAHSDEPTGVKGSTRLEAKKQRRREGREAGRRRTVITEAEFLARRESVERLMVVRNKNGRTQMGVLEDGVLVEHYIDQAGNVSMAGNIYLGRVQNVLPSMEAAFVDIGKGRNAVLYAGEVNWDAAGLDANQPKRIENALESGQTVLVQVTKDPIGHKGARLTSQISLPGRYLVYVPNSSMTGISRKLPDTERARLKKILRQVVPEHAGVIVRTAAEGATEEELRADVERLTKTWEDIQARAEESSTPRAGKSKGKKKNGAGGSSTTGSAPLLLHGEPDLTVRVIRDVFNEDFKQLVVSGEQAWQEIHPYIAAVAPDLADRVTKWTGTEDLFTKYRVDEQLAKAMDRKVWLPSGGSLVIDRTEAMTVIDVNTGKFVGSGGNLEETVTKNNLEAAEEIVRQLRLRDLGGIIVVDFIDMVLESNRDLVVRRLLECLGRDRTKHQVAEVTSLGLVQMTRKRVGSGLIEVFSETCEHCNGRGFIIHTDPVDKGAHGHDSSAQHSSAQHSSAQQGRRGRRGSDNGDNGSGGHGRGGTEPAAEPEPKPNGPTAAQIAAMAHAAALKNSRDDDSAQPVPEPAAETAAADRPQDVPEELVTELESEPQQVPTDSDAAAAAAAVSDEEQPRDVSGRQPDAAAEPQPQPDHEPQRDHEPQPDDTAQPQPEAARRSRRHRGRVVAPAGPPGGSQIAHVDSPDGAVGSTSGTEPAGQGASAGL